VEDGKVLCCIKAYANGSFDVRVRRASKQGVTIGNSRSFNVGPSCLKPEYSNGIGSDAKR
jgi:hypothetical protein